MLLNIDPEFKSLIPQLDKEEYRLLEESILAEGCRERLITWLTDEQKPDKCLNCGNDEIVWNCRNGLPHWLCKSCESMQNMVLLDGHNRYEICQRNGLRFDIKPMQFPSRQDAIIWIIKNQFGRRNLSAWQRSDLALRMEDIVKAKAKENLIISGKEYGKGSPTLANPIEKIDTREEIAKAANVSHGTIDKVRKIKEQAQPEQIEKLEKGEASINEVYKAIQQPHVANNSGNNEWYTPAEIIESVRAVLVDIDIDPASSEQANKVVKAMRYYTIETNGLDKPWFGTCFLNPPYSSDLIPAFIDKLIKEYDDGHVKEAIVLVNNATETRWFNALMGIAVSVCFPIARVKFWRPEGNLSGPLQGQAIAYIGDNPIGFMNEFSKHGFVLHDINKVFPENV